MNNYVYDFMLWCFTIIVDLFFREIHPRSSWKVPRKGPVIFVAAPHANQFVDPLILMRVVRNEAHRRIVFLIAEKSMQRKFIGTMAGAVGAVPVGRALDKTFSMTGKIYLPDPENDPTLIRGVNTTFKRSEVQVGGLLVLPSVKNQSANAEIQEIVSNDEIRLKKPFKGNTAINQLTGKHMVVPDNKTEEEVRKERSEKEFEGTSFKVAPKIDQTKVYDAVFAKLKTGGCIGIFPEGGSHDRTELLPIKAGVAIMALGALAADPDCGLTIVPCGMNYFHAHKFRSRAVVEFGSPVEVPRELVEMYKNGDRREAVSQLLDTVYQSLVAVTVTSPDYDTLMLIQAVRRLYNPKGKKLPLPMVVELNRRLVKGYAVYKDDPRIVNLKKNVMSYNKELLSLSIRDHQVERVAKVPTFKVIGMLIFRLLKLITLSLMTLPGLTLFAPVFIAGKLISIKKSREALAASTVKIQARDVMATWKLLVALGLAPTLYWIYTLTIVYWTYRNRIWGIVPEFVPLWLVFVIGYATFAGTTYAALRIGEVGMDIAKSLKPLVVALSPAHGNQLAKLRERRAKLSADVTDLINTLGPEVFPDFHSARIIADPFDDPTDPRNKYVQHSHNDSKDQVHSNDATGNSGSTTPDLKDHQVSSSDHPTLHFTEGPLPSMASHSMSSQHPLPRNESYKSLSNIALFASHPASPRHSRSRSRSSSDGNMMAFTNGSGLQAMSTIDGSTSHTVNTKDGLNEVTKKIRGAMRARNIRRNTETREDAGSEYESSGVTTPTSERFGSSANLSMSSLGRREV